MRLKSLIIPILLTLPACIVVETSATTAVTAVPADDATGEPASSFGPEPEPTTSGAPSDAGSSTGSDSTSSSGNSSEGSSGPDGQPLGDSCDFSRACELGVCAPNGECVDACDVDGRCAADELCLAGACVEVGSDMQEAQIVAFNDSPLGEIQAGDIDVWKQILPGPGSYSVRVSSAPDISAFVLSGAGQVLAGPDDAEPAGDFTSYPIQVADVALPIVILLMSDSPDPLPYYWYTIINNP